MINCRVPSDWIDGAAPNSDELWLKGIALQPKRQEQLLQALYGPTWRDGNTDGSAYVVLEIGSLLLNPSGAANRPWQYDDPDNPKYQYFYFDVADQDQFHRVTLATF